MTWRFFDQSVRDTTVFWPVLDMGRYVTDSCVIDTRRVESLLGVTDFRAFIKAV